MDFPLQDSERISEEAINISELFTQSFETSMGLIGECDADDLRASIGPLSQLHELDPYLAPVQVSNPNEWADTYEKLMESPLIFVQSNSYQQSPVRCVPAPKKSVKRVTKKVTSIALSQSVGVGQPQMFIRPSHQITIVHSLEKTFRPRYKSDYYAQNGKTRKPRYVADSKNNHYILLQVPVKTGGRIRVDWLTIPTKNGDRYWMPYRFQASNEEPDVLDCNPIYFDIKADVNGFMKVYLVLIKSKQDELKSLQPLKLFQPLKEAFGVSDKSRSPQVPHLSAKDLIHTYQLDKSQLAFTFCSIGKDGLTNIPEWDTTVFSTVLTEVASDAAQKKSLICPHCDKMIPVKMVGLDEERDETPISKKRKASQSNSAVLPTVSVPFKKQLVHDEPVDFLS